jgi:hypothetical protein
LLIAFRRYRCTRTVLPNGIFSNKKSKFG